jgi:S-adenosylmethionine synthetase
VEAIVISTQHHPDVNHARIVQDVTEGFTRHVVPSHLIDAESRIYVNPTGRFVIAGPVGDVHTAGGRGPSTFGPPSCA